MNESVWEEVFVFHRMCVCKRYGFIILEYLNVKHPACERILLKWFLYIYR